MPYFQFLPLISAHEEIIERDDSLNSKLVEKNSILPTVTKLTHKMRHGFRVIALIIGDNERKIVSF